MKKILSRPVLQSGLCRVSLPLLLIFLISFYLAGPALSAGSSQMLGEILAKTEANYENIHAFTAIFRQKTTSAAAGTLSAGEAQGRLYYEKPRQMRWEYDEPEEQVFVANNQYAWLFVRGENQITLFDAGKLFASPLARTFFDGALGLKNHFEITLDPIQSTAALAVLKLVPRQEDPNIKHAYLWIDLKTYRIYRVQTVDLLGNTNEISIESFTPHPSLEPGLFHLDVPASAKVFGADGHELNSSEIDQLKAKISSGKQENS